MSSSVVRIAMAKRVSSAWLKQNAQPEFKITVYNTSDEVKNLPAALRAFRSGKTVLGDLTQFPDFSLEVLPDQLVIRTANKEALVLLDAWLASKGYETTGIW